MAKITYYYRCVSCGAVSNFHPEKCGKCGAIRFESRKEDKSKLPKKK